MGIGEYLPCTIWLVPAQDVHFFYTRSHLSSLKSCALFFSSNFQFISTFKYCTTQFSYWIVSYTKNKSFFKWLFSKFAPSFVAIELLTFSKNSKFYYYCWREFSVFGILKILYVNRIVFLLFVYIKMFHKKRLLVYRILDSSKELCSYKKYS